MNKQFILLFICVLFSSCSKPQTSIKNNAQKPQQELEQSSDNATEQETGVDDPVHINGKYLGELPDLRLLNLNHVVPGDFPISLATGMPQSNFKNIFEMVLVVTRESIRLQAEALYSLKPDRNGDGMLNCDDYYYEDDSVPPIGMIHPLFCGKELLDNEKVVTIRKTTDKVLGPDLAFDFSKFTADSKAVGHWTATSADESLRYPLNGRGWVGDLSRPDGYKMRVHFDAEDAKNGEFYLNTSDHFPAGILAVGQKFATPQSTESCINEKVDQHCHNRYLHFDVAADAFLKLLTMENPFALTQAINEDVFKFDFSLMYNTHEAASFFVAEGKIEPGTTLTPFMVGTLSARFSAPPAMIYFRLAFNEDQLWGSFEFFDTNGNAVTFSSEEGNDITSYIRDGSSGKLYGGYCVDVKTYEEETCSSSNLSDFSQFWKGRDFFEFAKEEMISPVEIGPPPSKIGVTTL